MKYKIKVVKGILKCIAISAWKSCRECKNNVENRGNVGKVVKWRNKNYRKIYNNSKNLKLVNYNYINKLSNKTIEKKIKQ